MLGVDWVVGFWFDFDDFGVVVVEKGVVEGVGEELVYFDDVQVVEWVGCGFVYEKIFLGMCDDVIWRRLNCIIFMINLICVYCIFFLVRVFFYVFVLWDEGNLFYCQDNKLYCLEMIYV